MNDDKKEFLARRLIDTTEEEGEADEEKVAKLSTRKVYLGIIERLRRTAAGLGPSSEGGRRRGRRRRPRVLLR